MSVAGSSVSTLRPSSTVGRKEVDKISTRNAVLWFEKRLGLTNYLYNKRTDERLPYSNYIRINTKTLARSYTVPASDTYTLLRSLYKSLTPGLLAAEKKRDEIAITKKEDEDLQKLHNWMQCSDMTVQVFPKTGAVLWMDVECMRCKDGGDGGGRHLRSKQVATVAVRAVLDFKPCSAPDANEVYVTMGRTCGMHIFFPRILMESEEELQDVWAEVDRSFTASGLHAAKVDTGCSAMPLPLARNHNKLVRVRVEPTRVDYETVRRPRLDELARATNFYQFVSQSLVDHLPSSSSPSDVSSAISSLRSVNSSPREVVRCKGKDDLTGERIKHGGENSDAMAQTRKEIYGQEERIETRDVRGDDEKTRGDKENITASSSGKDNKGDEEKQTEQQVDAACRAKTIEGDDRTKQDRVTSRLSSDTNEVEMRSEALHDSQPELVFHGTENDVLSACPIQDRKRALEPDTDRAADSDLYQPMSPAKRCRATPTQETAMLDGTDVTDYSSLPQTEVKENTCIPIPLYEAEDTRSTLLSNGDLVSLKSPRTPAPTSLFGSIDEDGGASGSLSSWQVRLKTTQPTTDYGVDTAPPTPLFSILRQRNEDSTGKSTDDLSMLEIPSTSHRDVRATLSDESQPNVGSLYVQDDVLPVGARLPDLHFSTNTPTKGCFGSGYGEDSVWPRPKRDVMPKEVFERKMKLHLDDQHGQAHETDMQILLSSFNTEHDFYVSTMNGSRPVCYGEGGNIGLHIKAGGSLSGKREHCPAALFPEYVPHVVYSEDFVAEADWILVLTRYFDEYLNNPTTLFVMARVLRQNPHVKENLNAASLTKVEASLQNCLARFRGDAMHNQRKNDKDQNGKIYGVPRHPYEEKCTIVTGLIAVCSLAFRAVTPIFTDLAKTCHLLLGNNQQTLGTLNSSIVSDPMYNVSSYDPNQPVDDDSMLHESASQGAPRYAEEVEEDVFTGRSYGTGIHGTEQSTGSVPASIGNDHSVLASLLRWNYPACSELTLWCLFFYYHHVHADGLTRILNEVVHGGLMVTALLQAYLEDVGGNAAVDIPLVSSQWNYLFMTLRYDNGKQGRTDGDEEDEERKLMPPPKSRGVQQKRGRKGYNNNNGRATRPSDSAKQSRFDKRCENSKRAQRKVLDKRTGRREDLEGDDEEVQSEDDVIVFEDEEYSGSEHVTTSDQVLRVLVHRYLRPISFEETTLLYTETGYEEGQDEYTTCFASEKKTRRVAMDVFTRATLKYVMPHGDLLMYNTDLVGPVHKRSTCTNNLVLNIFENMYGGCMTFLTRHYNNNLKLFNRFNGDAYRLVVECRHAMNGLVQSIELSYINLLLRQPVVPPVLETDSAVRRMFMSDEEIMKGAFVCLNANDYVRSINMFTRHSKLSKNNCRVTEDFLDGLITSRMDTRGHSSGQDSHTRFRTVYLFFLLYMFEVLYKIRHAYKRDRTYCVSLERLSWDMDVRLLLKLFFGTQDSVIPQGLTSETLDRLGIKTDVYDGCGTAADECWYDPVTGDTSGRVGMAASVNTRSVVSTVLPDKTARMIELFGKKGVVVMSTYATLSGAEIGTDVRPTVRVRQGDGLLIDSAFVDGNASGDSSDTGDQRLGEDAEGEDNLYEDLERELLNMATAQLEEALYSSTKWYDNCRVRVKALHHENRKSKQSDKRTRELLEMSMDPQAVDTFLRTQLRVHIDNDRLGHVERAVRDGKDFEFCRYVPLRIKMTALVLASHAVKRLSHDVAAEFTRKEYVLERTGVVRFATRIRIVDDQGRDSYDNTAVEEDTDENTDRPDGIWTRKWHKLLNGRRYLLAHCRSLADDHFQENYFVGLRPDKTYDALYEYMRTRPSYATLHKLQNQPWVKDVCVALNYLLVINAYDTELVELCLRLFLGFEWPGQWAKRIFVWKSNSNAGKSFFFEHIIGKAFEKSTCINDPKGGKENAPEKSDYYKNFVLMINEFNAAQASELKRLCSTSGYKFRMNFGNQMIQAFMIGKMVLNCNSLPMTTDHATIQRVALVPLPFWFQKRQSVTDSMLNWNRGLSSSSDYEEKFRLKMKHLLTPAERRFFMENSTTRSESDLFNEPDQMSLKTLGKLKDYNAKASLFLVQNKTSQVYMSSEPATGTIISGIVLITKYFCRFRFFNTIKEPVDYSVVPAACVAAAQEWLKMSQPYFDWKERYRVHKDYTARSRVSAIHASLHHYAKNYARNASFFDLRQFFEFDFAEQKIPYYNAKEDEYYVKLDPLQE